ncbi:MAG: hypothetical protein VKJ02_07675 [Snowella sp.]|nr:hypothetical protein [Snowella sp.]
MLTQSVKVLTGVVAALAAYGISAMPAQAEPVQQSSEVLVSQLAGHDLWRKGGTQLLIGDYAIGRVRGVIGNILFIEFLKYPQSLSADGFFTVGDRRYSHVHLVGSAQPGDDVIVRRSGNTWEVAQAHPVWISRLNLKEVPTFERSAVNFESTAPVSLPPAQPAPAPTFRPAPAPAPAIRGLW